MHKARAFLADLSQQTGNKDLHAVPCDLGSLADVREAAATVLGLTSRVDSVICNAGIYPPFEPLTDDGLETAFAIQYVGHFFLVELLLPFLRESKGRVVHTSTAGVELPTLCSYFACKEDCTSLDTIAADMYLKTMHARELARREANNGVMAFSFQPGMVVTEGNNVSAAAASAACHPEGVVLPWYSCACEGPDGTPNPAGCPLSPAQGAQTGVYLAVAPSEELASVNGAMTVACGVQPDLAVDCDSRESCASMPPFTWLDPYEQMVRTKGLDATLEYSAKLYDLSKTWIPEEQWQGLESEPPAKGGVSLGSAAAVAISGAAAVAIGVMLVRKYGRASYRPHTFGMCKKD